MLTLAQIVLIAWVPLVIAIGWRFGWRQAAAFSLIGGFVLLPVNGTLAWPKSPVQIDKYVVAAVLAALCMALAGRERSDKPAGFAPKWFDVPVLVLCLVPMISAWGNNLGFVEEGVWHSWRMVVFWALPWWIGRRMGDRDGWMIILRTILILGLLYVPICLYEIIVGPDGYVAKLLYNYEMGYGGRSHSERLGGWRPMGFFENGVRLGRWMTIVVLFAGWWAVQRRPDWPASTRWAVFFGLLAVTALCRSLSWLVFLAIGLGLLAGWRWIVPRLTLVTIAVMLLAPIGYMGVRASGLWNGDQLIAVARQVNEKRAQSLEYRRDSETLYVKRAINHNVWIGYGGSWRWFKYPRIADQRWVVFFGNFGLLGLASWLAIFSIPAVAAAWQRRRSIRFDSEDDWLLLPLLFSALAIVDGMFNALGHPIFVMSSGVLVTAIVTARSTQQGADTDTVT